LGVVRPYEPPSITEMFSGQVAEQKRLWLRDFYAHHRAKYEVVAFKDGEALARAFRDGKIYRVSGSPINPIFKDL
jgi:hypothetical protein